MGFRITTNMSMNTYRYNLQNSNKKLSDARDLVLTHRNFNSYAEDPASATQAFRLRRDFYQTNNQLNSTKTAYSKFNTAWNNLGGVVEKMSDAVARVSSIRGNNGTAGESRSALAVALRETAESVIHAMNQQLGDHFIFGGNDALNVPFEWKGEELYYRGINVNSGSMEKPEADPVPDWMDDLKQKRADEITADTWTEEDEAWYNYYNHESIKAPSSPEPGWLKIGDPDSVISQDPAYTLDAAKKEQEWLDYYNHKVDQTPRADEPAWAQDKKYFDEFGAPIVKELVNDGVLKDPVDSEWVAYYNDQANLNKLKAMSKEEMYIDLGMGLKENGANNPITGSYFNTALSGVDFIDYGVDEDGDPKNLALIMKELAGVFDKWNENGQRYVPDKYKDMSYQEVQDILNAGGPEAEEIKAFHDEYEAKAFRLMDKLKAAQEHTTEKWVDLDAKSSFLQTNEERLTTQSKDLNAQVLDIEQINLAEAITQFSWDQYCYNAALKVGNQLLSQSLIDYMN